MLRCTIKKPMVKLIEKCQKVKKPMVKWGAVHATSLKFSRVAGGVVPSTIKIRRQILSKSQCIISRQILSKSQFINHQCIIFCTLTLHFVPRGHGGGSGLRGLFTRWPLLCIRLVKAFRKCSKSASLSSSKQQNSSKTAEKQQKSS